MKFKVEKKVSSDVTLQVVPFLQRLRTSCPVHSKLGLKLNRVIDPSAGSPTETLLRLLLPLSNKVHLISSTGTPANRCARLSKIFTGLLNR